MRLWHKSLVSVLPKNQLVGQLRELSALSSKINNPNHILVNKIKDYDISHYYTYCVLIFEEMRSRKYNIKPSTIKKILSCVPENTHLIELEDLFYEWHNNRYLTQCYYNLQEKYDCGGISKEVWRNIDDRYNSLL